MVNKDLAAQIPAQATFLQGLNDRLYDLMDIFSKQFYVRKEFLGKTSIKNVLPALVPQFSYSDLAIQDGGTACSSYKHMIWEDVSNSNKQQTNQDLLAYCCLDTLAMVEILEHVRGRAFPASQK